MIIPGMVIIMVMPVLTRIMLVMMLDVRLGRDPLEMGLEFAVPLLFRQGTDLHVDVSTGHLGLLVDMPHGVQVLLDTLGQLMPELLVRHLTPLEL